MERDDLPNRIPLFQGRGVSRGMDLGLCGTQQVMSPAGWAPCIFRALPCCPPHSPHGLLFF